MTGKDALRQENRKRISALTGIQHAALSAAIRSVLASWPPYKSARSLIAFHPMKGEPDFVPLLLKAISGGHSVGLVRTPDADPRQGILEVRLWDGAENNLERHRRMPLLQPGDHLPFLDNAAWNQPRNRPAGPNIELMAADAGLVLVPGLAFGRDGSRLGQGSGWYDGFLKAKPGLLRAGIGFGLQVQDSLPVDEWDQILDFIITEEGIQACPANT